MYPSPRYHRQILWTINSLKIYHSAGLCCCRCGPFDITSMDSSRFNVELITRGGHEYATYVDQNKHFSSPYPAGVLRRRLLHRNGTFVPPAPSTRTRWRVKTDFRQKTGRSRAVYASIQMIPRGKTSRIAVRWIILVLYEMCCTIII